VRGASKGWWKRGGEGVEEEGRGGENDEVKSNQFQTNEVNPDDDRSTPAHARNFDHQPNVILLVLVLS
jgi:hypothetical protein